MTTQHTPEPWAYSVNVGPTKGLIVEADGSTILAIVNAAHDSPFEANASRIVACVNACAGIPTSHLDASSRNSALQQIIEQRDELAEALRDLVRAYEHKWSDEPVELKARAALAKVQP